MPVIELGVGLMLLLGIANRQGCSQSRRAGAPLAVSIQRTLRRRFSGCRIHSNPSASIAARSVDRTSSVSWSRRGRVTATPACFHCGERPALNGPAPVVGAMCGECRAGVPRRAGGARRRCGFPAATASRSGFGRSSGASRNSTVTRSGRSVVVLLMSCGLQGCVANPVTTGIGPVRCARRDFVNATRTRTQSLTLASVPSRPLPVI